MLKVLQSAYYILYCILILSSFPDPLLRLPLYPLIYLLVHWHGYITVVCFVGADGFFLGFCLYLTVLLLSLRDDVCDLMELQRSDKTAEELHIVRQMERLIDRHNEVAELTERLSGIMVEITLGHFVTSSLIIGTSVVDMLLVRNGLISFILRD